MTVKRVRARTAKAARRKAGGKMTVVSKVNMINKSSGKKGMKTYSVTTKKKKRK